MYRAGVRKYRSPYTTFSARPRGKREPEVTPDKCGMLVAAHPGPVGTAAHARAMRSTSNQSELIYNNPKAPFPEKYFNILRASYQVLPGSAFNLPAFLVLADEYLRGNWPGDVSPSTTIPGDANYFTLMSGLYLYGLCRSSRVTIEVMNNTPLAMFVVLIPTAVDSGFWPTYLPQTWAQMQTWAGVKFVGKVQTTGDGGRGYLRAYATFADVVGLDSGAEDDTNLFVYGNAAVGTTITPPPTMWYWIPMFFYEDGTPITAGGDPTFRMTIDYYVESFCPIGQVVGTLDSPRPRDPVASVLDDFEDMDFEQVIY